MEEIAEAMTEIMPVVTTSLKVETVPKKPYKIITIMKEATMMQIKEATMTMPEIMTPETMMLEITM